ncbi:MAG TPA: hypothetical protein VGX52_21230 [Burkholderiales bacterium]|nr:hypothetical protein [Burkholderiales bacterium]
MRGFIGVVLLGFSVAALSQDKSERRELIGKIGTRSALLLLHTAQRADGSWQAAGEYVILPTLVRRFVEGERSPELGVTVLKEGTTPILFGRPGIGELRGTWRDGTYKGTRHGPGGQKREEFEFSEDFPSMENYSAKVRCEAKEGRYQSRLSLSVENGKLKSLDWRSVEPDGQACSVAASDQQPMRGGLRFVAGNCRVTLRDAGEFVALSADSCAAHCGAEAHIAPLLIDRRGNCELLRHGAR